MLDGERTGACAIAQGEQYVLRACQIGGQIEEKDDARRGVLRGLAPLGDTPSLRAYVQATVVAS